MFRTSLNIQNSSALDNSFEIFRSLLTSLVLSKFDRIYSIMHELSRPCISDRFFSKLAFPFKFELPEYEGPAKSFVTGFRLLQC